MENTAGSEKISDEQNGILMKQVFQIPLLLGEFAEWIKLMKNEELKRGRRASFDLNTDKIDP